MTSDLIETFLTNWRRWGGSWERRDSPISARLALLSYLSEQRQRTILSWQVAHLPIPALDEVLKDAGFTLISPYRQNLTPDLALGLTAADAGLAANGALALVPAIGRSWTPALIPIRHVVLLPASRLYADLDAWRQAWLRTRPQDAARALIISGPSVSDAIELHPHRGMFGPRWMHLILFDDKTDG